LVVALIAALGWWAYSFLQATTLRQQVPSSVKQAVPFPIYIPDSARFSVDKSSFKYENNVLLFRIDYNGGSYIATEQQKPDGFKLSEYKTSQGLTDTRDIHTNIGVALAGNVLNRNVAIVDADGTLISLASTGAADQKATDELAASFVHVR
jgi:hypothetical protein